MRSEYTTCSNCDLMNEIKPHYTYEVLPKKGVHKSEIKQNYCSKCEVHTPWFLAKGYEDEIDKLQIEDLRSVNLNIEILEKELNQLQTLVNKNIIYKMMFLSRKNTKERKLKETFHKRNDIDNKINNIIKNSKSFNFYAKNSLNPRCIFCGNDKFLENPKHHCGGNLKIELSDLSFNISLMNSKILIYTYDKNGSSIKKYCQKFIENNKLYKYSKIKSKNKSLNLIPFKYSNKVIIYEKVKDDDYLDPFVAELNLETYVKTFNESKKIDSDTKKSIDDFLFKLEKEVEIKTIAEKAQEQLKRDVLDNF